MAESLKVRASLGIEANRLMQQNAKLAHFKRDKIRMIDDCNDEKMELKSTRAHPLCYEWYLPFQLDNILKSDEICTVAPKAKDGEERRV